jgi:acetyl-CoA acetyltransferase
MSASVMGGMMTFRGEAVIAGVFEYPPERKYTGPRLLAIEQWAELARLALADARIDPREVDGLVCGDLRESEMFVPATIAEYLGWTVNFAERVDLGGASPVGMLWRAATAIELGLCETVVCAAPARPRPRPPVPQPSSWTSFGASSGAWGSPQAEFEIPYGNVAQNVGYAMIAQRYAAEFGYDERATAKIAVDQRTNACANPAAVFHGQPITVEDVLASKLVADPLHLLEIVMPCTGGAAFVVTTAERARASGHRPVHIVGFGESLSHKTPTFAPDLVRSPIAAASRRAFSMAGLTPGDVDVVQLYDCYTITVLLSIEDAGFCEKGEGMAFVREHDLTWRGDFPTNTHGGQLGFGQAGAAGGFSQIVEGVHQLRGTLEERQVEKCDVAFVSGTGGIMSEQTAVLLRGT